MTCRRDTRTAGRGLAAVAVAVALLTAGCSEGSTGAAPPAPASTTAATPSASAATTPEPTPAAESEQAPERVRAGDLDVAVAMRAVRHLAGRIGPRHATSPAYREAADWVAGRFQRLGLDVRRQAVATPGGLSWGVPVEPGTSYNVIATPPGLRRGDPHLVVGAHLDTVPQAPGAEDNASGIGVLLAAGKALRGRTARLPVVLVAFGAEEPRGDTDADHHYGSRAYVASLTPRERRGVRGMVSLDRVGVGTVVPVGSGLEGGGGPAAAAVVRAARRVGVPVAPEANRSSDHWSFVRAGLPGVRLGSTPYAGYHSPGDVPEIVDPAQLRRAGRILLAWLAR